MKIWNSIQVVKKIDILSYTSEYRQGVLDVMRKSFFSNEVFCKALKIPGNVDAENDLLGLVDDCLARSKVSLVAKDSDTGKIIGAAVNLIQVVKRLF